MKLVRENINEKFEKDSDPIKDMGIGKISFEAPYYEIYKDIEREAWKKWKDYVYQFKGKTICGKFHYYESGKYDSIKKYAEVRFTYMDMNEDGILNLKDEYNDTYCILRNEKYIIKD